MRNLPIFFVLFLVGCDYEKTTEISLERKAAEPVNTVEKLHDDSYLKVNRRCIGKVDINTADSKQLTRIIHIDENKAQEIIKLRPFITIESLSLVRGIYGEILRDIIRDELSCIEREIS